MGVTRVGRAERDRRGGHHERALRKTAERCEGLRRVRRPASSANPAFDNPAFDLAYLRSGPRSATPIVVIPGGPGMASALPYRRFRARATRAGYDVIMIEHRGVGLSRTDLSGADLPRSAMRITEVVDDVAAVLDHEGVDRAHIYGSSYGTYIAQGVGVRHPDRVAGMILDSTLLSARDYLAQRAHSRRLLWDGEDPQTAEVAGVLRRVVATGTDMTDGCGVAQILYEFDGPALLSTMLERHLAGSDRLTWAALERMSEAETAADGRVPYTMEQDPVSEIAFRELNFAPEPDGGPFDTSASFADAARRYSPFSGEPFDLAAELPRFTWPTAIIAGRRDLRTPPPIAELTASLIPDAVLVPIDNGHSALDTHHSAALHVIGRVLAGRTAELAGEGPRIDAMPARGGATRWLPLMVRAALVADLVGDRVRHPRLPGRARRGGDR